MNLAELESQKEVESLNPFYVSFSDLVVLLCAFFAMMVGMSKIDIGSFEKIKTGITGSKDGTLVELAENLQIIADGPPEIGGVSVQLADDGVRLDLETAALFKTGSAVLKPGALDPLAGLLDEIKKTAYTIDIEGHADDQRLFRRDGDEIETNWSLSGRRASTVVFHMQEFGFDNSRLRIVGYASNKPKVDIVGKIGVALEKARAENRRVSLLVH